jgi:hypothetical protein
MQTFQFFSPLKKFSNFPSTLHQYFQQNNSIQTRETEENANKTTSNFTTKLDSNSKQSYRKLCWRLNKTSSRVEKQRKQLRNLKRPEERTKKRGEIEQTLEKLLKRTRDSLQVLVVEEARLGLRVCGGF